MRLVWTFLLSWAILLGSLYLLRAHSSTEPVNTRPLSQVLSLPFDDLIPMHGAQLDSGTHRLALLFLDPKCPACRLESPTYQSLSALISKYGVVTVAVIAGDSLPAYGYSRLLPYDLQQFRDPELEVFNAARTLKVPQLLLIEKNDQGWLPLGRVNTPGSNQASVERILSRVVAVSKERPNSPSNKDVK